MHLTSKGKKGCALLGLALIRPAQPHMSTTRGPYLSTTTRSKGKSKGAHHKLGHKPKLGHLQHQGQQSITTRQIPLLLFPANPCFSAQP